MNETYSQEARTPDLPSKYTPRLQVNGMFHFAEALDQRGLSTPSTSHVSDARDQSNTISHFPGLKNTVPITTAKGTKLSTVGPSEGT